MARIARRDNLKRRSGITSGLEREPSDYVWTQSANEILSSLERSSRASPKSLGMNAMNIDTTAIDDAVLALLYLTLHDHNRAWKSFDWDALNRLYERGFIGDPVNKAKSVILTDKGVRESERLFKQHFATLGREPHNETDL